MYLETIVEKRRQDVEEAKKTRPLEAPAPLRESGRFYRSLAQNPIGLICEIKRASPSKGPLADIPSPAALARVYEQSGACAISVLTEERHFKGTPADLIEVRQSVGIPVLRKDFIVDAYQVLEAAHLQADAYLLIVAILDDETLCELISLGHALGLEPLLEVHDAAELERALGTEARVIGINNRSLKTFDVNLDRTLDLIPRIPAGRLIVAESGYSDRKSVVRVEEAGAHGVLIGEALVTAGDPGTTIRKLAGFL